jgi:hypothetical protein
MARHSKRDAPRLETQLERSIFWALRDWLPAAKLFERDQIEGAKLIAHRLTVDGLVKEKGT